MKDCCYDADFHEEFKRASQAWEWSMTPADRAFWRMMQELQHDVLVANQVPAEKLSDEV